MQEGFNKFFWGFLFIMFDFRLQGIDVLPDVIGFILFATGFAALAEHSEHFVKGKPLNVVLLILSIFTIYEQPTQGGGVHFNLFAFVINTVALVLLLLVVHHLLMGIKDLASRQERSDMENEASQNWTYFLIFNLVSLSMFVLIFIPPLFILLVIALFVGAIVLMVKLMRFMKKCGEQL